MKSVWMGLALFAVIAGSRAQAASPAFTNLSQSDVDNIEREMAANTNLHDVLPPSSLGSIFGFEVGIVGGETNSPNINSLVQEASTTASVNQLPHAALVGAVTIPYGLTFEATYLPQLSISGSQYQEYAAALKWTLTDSTNLPLNIAVRGFYSHSQFSFTQTTNDQYLGPVNVGVANSTTMKGGQVLISPKLIPILEPYIGLGYVWANGNLNVSGDSTATLFNFTHDQNAASSPSSSQIVAGLDIRLLFIGIGVEYSHAFNTDSYTGKLSFKF